MTIEKVCCDCGGIFYQKVMTAQIRCAKCVNKFNYKNRKKEKYCKYCGSLFIGTDKQLNCSNCIRKRVVNTNGSTQKILCANKKCDNIIRTRQTKIATIPEKRGGKICEVCKINSSKKRSEYMKTDINPSIKKHGRKIKNVLLTPEEARFFNSRRMMGDLNPMKRPEIKDKVFSSDGYKNNIKNLKEKVGRNHHLWKGTRPRTHTIRSRLYNNWILPILKKSNFSCEICERRGGRLEVHHQSETFRDIISKYDNNNQLKNMSDEDFEILSKKVVNYHINNVIGICVCVDCHRKIDENRK